jgi:hypothetical protein
VITARSMARAAAEVEDGPIPETAPAKQVRWSLILVWFMRVVALLWVVKGVAAWCTILGFSLRPPPFELRPTSAQAVVIYFATIDLIAAVGLWLTSTWGGVLWLLAVVSHLIMAVFFPRVVSNGALLIALFIVSITMYLVLSWLAEIEE